MQRPTLITAQGRVAAHTPLKHAAAAFTTHRPDWSCQEMTLGCAAPCARGGAVAQAAQTAAEDDRQIGQDISSLTLSPLDVEITMLFS